MCSCNCETNTSLDQIHSLLVEPSMSRVKIDDLMEQVKIVNNIGSNLKKSSETFFEIFLDSLTVLVGDQVYLISKLVGL